MATEMTDARSHMSTSPERIMAGLPTIWPTPWGPMLANAPEGMCPWGEAKCDDKCEDQHGCKFDYPRDRERGEVEHGHHGAHQEIV